MTGPNEHDDERSDGERPEPESIESMHDLAAAYALHALDDHEAADVERALAESPELRDESDAFAETSAHLADLVEPEDPPPALRSRLMAQIETTPQSEAENAAPVGARPAEEAAQRRWFQRPGLILAAAAAGVVLIVGAVLGVGWFGPNGWGAQLERAAITAAPDAETATVDADGTEVSLISSAERGRSVLVAEALPEVGDDQTFQLWYIGDSGAASAGTFDASDGETWRVLEGEFSPGVSVGVTVEPAGGSPQPTTDPLVVITT